MRARLNHAAAGCTKENSPARGSRGVMSRSSSPGHTRRRGGLLDLVDDVEAACVIERDLVVRTGGQLEAALGGVAVEVAFGEERVHRAVGGHTAVTGRDRRADAVAVV